MRHIVAVLIALLVMLPLIFAVGAQTSTTSSSTSTTAASTAPLAPVSPKSTVQTLPAQTGIDTTQSIAAFMNDNWLPPTYAAPVQTAVAGGNATAANATANATALANAQFLADSSIQSAYQSPVNVAEAANKNGVRQQSGYAILDFLDDNWVPGAVGNQAQFVDLSSAGYSMHRMS